ncbi:hypothetical protein Lal_00002049 [Lupinus albus]|nr:hypothetical protein Lal_00002049 [Lupinus albus]
MFVTLSKMSHYSPMSCNLLELNVYDEFIYDIRTGSLVPNDFYRLRTGIQIPFGTLICSIKSSWFFNEPILETRVFALLMHTMVLHAATAVLDWRVAYGKGVSFEEVANKERDIKGVCVRYMERTINIVTRRNTTSKMRTRPFKLTLDNGIVSGILILFGLPRY